MLIVLAYFLLFLVVWRFSMNQPYKQSRNTQMILCFIMLFVFFGFRDLPILNDTGHYYGHYLETLSDINGLKHIFKYDPNERFEYGFQVLERILIKYVSENPYTIIIFSAFVITICNILFFKKYTQRIALALFLFFINVPQYSAIRQSFAVMFFYLAFEYLLEKKYIKYFILAAVAYLFHKSALVIFIFPLLCMLKVNKRNIIIVMLGTIAVAYMIYPILQMLNMGDTFYYETSLERETLPIAQSIIALQNIIMALSCYIVWKRISFVPIPQPIVWASVMSISISMIAVPFGIIARYGMFFNPYLLVMFLFFIEHSSGFTTSTSTNYSATMEGEYYGLSRQAWKLLIFFIILNIAKFMVVNTYKNEWSHLIPYTFFDFAPGIHNFNFGY